MVQSPRTSRPLVIASVMASMFMVAIEATIVSTAMPQIVAELGGLDLYSWVFSAFLLTQTAMTVVFGKLSDLYGRKPVMLAGIGIFVAASVLAGLAWSMPSMIVFRLLQGVGAGAMQPVAMTIVADLFPARERGKVQGYLASVWAISAVTGPLAGGLIIRSLSWAWIFWINVPIGIAAAAGFILFLHETVAHQERSIDYAGAVLFTLAIAALMAALTLAGSGDTGRGAIAAAAFTGCLVLFVVQERRAPDPMVSFALWRRRPIAAANGATLLASMALMGLTTFLPMYMQGVLHRSPVVAGLALTMMVLGWPAGATVAGKTFPVVGLRRLMLIGSVLLPIGASVFLVLHPGSPTALAGAGSLIMGFGMGLLSVGCLVLIQEIVDWSQRGSATASNLFARNLGSTLGATVLGAILNWGLVRGGIAEAVTSDRLRQVLEQPAGSATADAALETALGGALHLTFVAMLVLSLAIVAVTAMVPASDIGRPARQPA
jgi:EmrB/QacA subfamily drug resistance transporter